VNPPELLPQVYAEFRLLAAAKMAGEPDGHMIFSSSSDLRPGLK
jgi:hypothetical protein